MLSFNQLIDHADLVFNFDNEQLYNILKRNFKQENPSYPELNALIARVMSGISTPFRFSGQLNSDLRKLGTNLVPFPRLHFFTASYAPLVAPGAKAFERSSVSDIITALIDAKNQMAAADIRSGKFLTVACYLRGRDISSREVDEAMSAIQRRVSQNPLRRPELSPRRGPIWLTTSSVRSRRTATSSPNGFQTLPRRLSARCPRLTRPCRER